MKHRTRRICIIFTIVFVALFALVGIIGCGDDVADPPEITDIYARDVEVEYDGAKHGIVIENLLATDAVYYLQSDGTWSTEQIAYVVPGEYVVEFRVEREGFKQFTGKANIKIKPARLDGIYSTPQKRIYDGEAYGIIISGTRDSDVITYSSDGETFSAVPVTVREVGEYEVFFRVVRGYAEYSGSGVIVILPDIRGEYVNVTEGVITIAENTAVIGDYEYPMTYDVDGVGKISDAEFCVRDGVLTVGGTEYIKRRSDQRIYALEINGNNLFVLGGEAFALSIRFEERTGIVKADGVEIARFEGYNYCESEDSAQVDMEISEEHTAIELSLRAEQQVSEKVMYIVYDGAEHGYETEYDGTVLYFVDGEYTTVSPVFSEVGRHETRALYKRAGYLPAEVTVVMEIVPSIYGMYCDENAVIYITASGAQINGRDITCKLVDGKWIVDGDVYTLNGDTLTNETTSVAYARTERAFAIFIGSNVVIKTEMPTQVTLTIDKNGAVVVTGKEGEIIARGTLDGGATVTVNGKVMFGEQAGETTVYAIGLSELDYDLVIIAVKAC